MMAYLDTNCVISLVEQNPVWGPKVEELPQGGSGPVEDGTAESTSPADKTMFPGRALGGLTPPQGSVKIDSRCLCPPHCENSGEGPTRDASLSRTHATFCRFGKYIGRRGRDMPRVWVPLR